MRRGSPPIGAVDEANAAIGMARLHAEGEMDAMLARIQNDLFDLGADLCVPEDGRARPRRLRIAAAQVERLEREIDAMNAELAPLTSFVLPGGTRAGRASASGARHRAPRRAADGRACRNSEKVGARGAGLHQPAVRPSVRDGRAANERAWATCLWVPGANR